MAFSENLRKFVNTTNQAFNRAVQLTGETIGSTPRTSYDDEILRLIETSEKVHKCCDKLQSGVTAWLNANPIDRVQEKVLEKLDSKRPQKLTSSELFGQLNLTLSEELAGSPLSISLAQYGSGLLELGQCEREMSNDIQKNLLAITRYYLDVTWPDIQRQRRSLEASRLDYDSILLKHVRCTDVAKQAALESEVKEKKAKFDTQCNLTENLLKDVEGLQLQLQNGLKEMAATQTRYYTACQQQMKQLTERLENPT